MTTSSLSSLRIFVSHSSKDDGFGVKLVEDLRRVLGNVDAVWYDSHGGLQGGDRWWQKIMQELRTCNVFIVVLSPGAMESPYVNAEIDLAWRQKLSESGKIIIPVLYRKCKVRDDLDTLQIINFLSPKPYEQAFKELLNALQLSTQSIPQPKSRVSIIHPLVDRTASTIKLASRISKERMVQTVALLVIIAGIIFSSICINQSVSAAAAITNQYPFSNQMVLNDSLTNVSNIGGWETLTDRCLITHQGYLVKESKTDYFQPCFAAKTNFKNFTYEVTMTITEGDCGTLLFRANKKLSKYYLFDLCVDGYYDFNAYPDATGKLTKTLKDWSPSGFNIALNHTVTVAVMAHGKSIDFYVNTVHIDHFIDSIYSEGQIGVAAYSSSSDTTTEVLFSNVKVWAL